MGGFDNEFNRLKRIYPNKAAVRLFCFMLLSVTIVEMKCFGIIFNLSFPTGFDKFKYVGMLDVNAMQSKLNR